MRSVFSSPSADSAARTGAIVLGDGSPGLIIVQQASGLILVRQTALAQICAQLKSGGQNQLREDSEACGLLTGRKSQNGDLLVQETIPLDFEDRSGRPFALLLADELATLDAQQEGPKTPLGFYRILTRHDQIRGADPESPAAIDLTLPAFDSLQCCFVLAPLSPAEISLRVLMRNGTRWEQAQQFTLQPTPEPAFTSPSNADPVRQNPGKPSANGIARRAPVARATVPQARQSEAYDGTPPRNSGRNQTAAISLALGVAAIIGLAGTYRWMSERRVSAGSNPQPESRKALLPHFSANRDGSGWKLTWDPAVVTAIQPTSGILSIQDGAAQQEIPLTRADLSSGTIYYSPTTDELAFGIQLLKDGIALAEERIRVLGGINPVNKPADTFQAPRPHEQGRQPGATSPQARSSERNFVPAPATHPPSTAEPILRNAVVRRSFGPPISIGPSKEVPVISTAAAPHIALGVPVIPAGELEGTFAASSVPPPPVPVPTPGAFTASASPVAAALTPTTSPSVLPSQSNFVGAKPIKQVQPTASDVAGQKGTVELRLVINAKGKVTKVTPIGGTRNFQLTAAAIKAAEFWEFEPARLNGLVVPSEMNLIFHF